MLFVGILIPVILQGVALSNRAAVVAERSALATELAEARLNQIRIEGLQGSMMTHGEFKDDFPGFRWRLETKPWTVDRLTEATLVVAFDVQGREREVRLTTLLDQ